MTREDGTTRAAMRPGHVVETRRPPRFAHAGERTFALACALPISLAHHTTREAFDMAKDHESLGDDQGTRIGAPDKARSATPAAHNDGPTCRPERVTGAGREATVSDQKSEEHDAEHDSGYGGKAGAPKTSSDKR